MQQKQVLNRLLASNGLGTLDEAAGLVAQLGYLVEDHDHFRQLLVACVPEERTSMYESLRPYLRFQPKPLDVYVSEAGAIADAKQLPIQTPEGTLRAHNTPELVTANQAAARTVAKGSLALVCRKCTLEEHFVGVDKRDAIKQARDAGWTYDELNGNGREICPTCPGSYAGNVLWGQQQLRAADLKK